MIYDTDDGQIIYHQKRLDNGIKPTFRTVQNFVHPLLFLKEGFAKLEILAAEVCQISVLASAHFSCLTSMGLQSEVIVGIVDQSLGWDNHAWSSIHSSWHGHQSVGIGPGIDISLSEKTSMAIAR